MFRARHEIVHSLLFAALSLLLPVVVIVARSPKAAAQQLNPGCYIENAGELTPTPGGCPHDVPNDGRCWVAPGSSHGIGTYQPNDCGTLAEQGPQRAADPDCKDLENCAIVRNYLIPAIDVLSAVVGVVVVIMIVIGGIQYTAARDNPQAVAAARQHILNAVLALVIYLGMVAFLQWLVPGGIFT